MNGNKLIGCLVVMLCGYLVFVSPASAVPQFKQPTGFDKDVEYDIYYAPSKKEVDVVSSVKIVGTRMIEDKKFLVAVGARSLVKKELYVDFDKISAVIPSGDTIVNRNFCPQT